MLLCAMKKLNFREVRQQGAKPPGTAPPLLMLTSLMGGIHFTNYIKQNSSTTVSSSQWQWSTQKASTRLAALAVVS